MSDAIEVEGGGAAFPATRHSVVRAASSDDQEERQDAWERLVGGYWRPVYKYLRLRHGRGDEDARDLTQGFFAQAMEKEFFRGFDPARARFRTFLRVCLDGFVSNEDKARRAQKRGGRSPVLSLDFEGAEQEIAGRHPPAAAEVDAFFHAEWLRGLLTGAIDDLRRACRDRDQETRFQVFERYDLVDPGPGPRPTYEALGAQAGVPATTVTNWLHALRRELREHVRRRLRALAADDDEYRADARELLGIDPR